MDFATLKSQVGNRIKTTSRNFITDGEIGTEINNSLDRLTRRVDIEESITESSISFTGDGKYDLPDDFVRPSMLYDESNDVRYSRVSPSAGMRSQNMSVDVYAIRGSKIEVWSGQDSTTLTLVYISDKNALDSQGNKQNGLSADGDKPIIPSVYHQYFVEDTAKWLHKKREEMQDYKIEKNEANTIFLDLKRIYPGRTETITERITPYDDADQTTFRTSTPPISN